MNLTSSNALPTFTKRPAKTPNLGQSLLYLCQGCISIDVIRQVQQADFGFSANYANSSEEQPSSHHHLNSKHMLNYIALSRPGSVAFPLSFCQTCDVYIPSAANVRESHVFTNGKFVE